MSTSHSVRGPLLILAAAASCLASIAALSGAAADPDADAKALRRIDEEWSKAAAAHDTDKVASFYADDAIAYPPNEPAANGRPAARKVWAAYLAAPSFSISWKTIHVEVSKGGDIGYTAGTYEDSRNGPDGRPIHEKGKYVCVWKKQKDGSWKAIHDIWNSDAK